MTSNRIDEGTVDELTISISNKLNGEMFERKITNAWEAKELWTELAENERIFKTALAKVKSYLDTFLGEDEQYKFVDGTQLKRIQRSTINWRPQTLRQFLDEDQIDVCLTVNKTTAKAILKEMMEKDEIPGNSLKLMDEQGEHKASAPFLGLN